VPRRYVSVEEREYVWLSMHTDSELVAMRKAPAIWDHMIEAWEAKLAGAEADGNAQLAAAKNLAAMRGYRYLQAIDVAKLPLDELLARVEAVVMPSGKIDHQEAAALLGGAPEPRLKVSEALEQFWSIGESRTEGKSAQQIKRWESPRKKTVANFIKTVSDLDVGEIKTSDLMAYRAWLYEQIKLGKTSQASANKDLMFLVGTIKEVTHANDILIKFNSDRLLFTPEKPKPRPPFSRAWISDKLLAPGALVGLNSEARCILLGMINTGYRPSEGASLGPAQIRLDSNVPHIKIEPALRKEESDPVRKLKTDSSERIIPLVGVSLEAFRQFPGGFPRYADRVILSDTINDYLRAHHLMETDKHTLYCLRHSFEDRLLAAGVDERIRMDLMGHQIKRERYGAGADLDHLQRVVQKVAL
jgi:integrase